MLSDITEQCIELIFQHSSPVTQVVDIDHEKEFRTWHQRFAFIKSIIDKEEFADAVNKIISSPVTKWKEEEAEKDIRCLRKINSKTLRQLSGAKNRIKLPDDHVLNRGVLQTVPLKIIISNKTETADTPENRFIKHALQSFLFFVSDFISRLENESKTKQEALQIESLLGQILSHSLFKEISAPNIIVLNNPVLQRKEGYRDILKIWLMFSLAAKISWEGGDDVYDIEKRNVATLYEYWLYFELLKILESVFGIKPGKELIVDTKDRLCLQLKQGIRFTIEGECTKYNRNLKIQFSYNRTFSGSNTESNYPDGGSWTRNMRPDYTLSIWPAAISEEKAEKEELIVHIHFDAKYKIEKILESFGEVENLDEEKIEQSKGTYKRADLLKMHSYKDAIRRTGGAYILYPGKEKTTYSRMGFNEIIPGLGAFQIRPSESGDNGSKELEKFFEDVVFHFVNRASQREKTANKIYNIHKDKPKKEDEVRDQLPEYIENNKLIPDETFVLIAYYKSKEHLEWINKGLYNARTGKGRGALKLGTSEAGAKYILLHSENDSLSNKLYQTTESGPRILSSQELKDYGYPTEPSQDFYLVYNVEKVHNKEYVNRKWDITRLEGYKGGMGSPLPFSVTLTELMKVAI